MEVLVGMELLMVVVLELLEVHPLTVALVAVAVVLEELATMVLVVAVLAVALEVSLGS